MLEGLVKTAFMLKCLKVGWTQVQTSVHNRHACLMIQFDPLPPPYGYLFSFGIFLNNLFKTFYVLPSTIVEFLSIKVLQNEKGLKQVKSSCLTLTKEQHPNIAF